MYLFRKFSVKKTMLSAANLYITLLICANTVTITFACEYNSGNRRAGCTSLEDLRASGSQPEWLKLGVVAPNGNKHFVPVKANTFAFVPNVDDLQIKGFASKLEAGAFNGLNHIIELHFDDNNLGVVSGEPFSDIPVQWIYMFNCGITEVKPHTFHNLPDLTKVDLQGNYLPIIEEGIYTNLKIKDLILQRNKVKIIKPNAFGNMANLKWLNLENNELTSFDTQFVLGYTPTLTQLFINRNQLTRASRDMFSVVPNLVTLLINLNKIERLGDYAFNDLKKVTLLDISNNLLEEIQPNVFNADGKSELFVLLTHNNNITFLTNDTLNRLPALKHIAPGGNPWQCPCWDLLNNYMKRRHINNICYEIYTKGLRPYCVLSDLYRQDCIYDVENVRGLSGDYYKILKDYPTLPPVCYFHGTNVPFLGP